LARLVIHHKWLIGRYFLLPFGAFDPVNKVCPVISEPKIVTQSKTITQSDFVPPLPVSPFALLPFLIFLSLFIGSGLYYQNLGTDFAFYQIKTPVAILPAILIAFLMVKGSFNNALDTFIKGVGDNTIITMVLIFLLAGAFASVMKSIGAVDATVNFALASVPSSFILPGLFIISAFIATAMGTSMGTIAAIAPVALGVSEVSDIDLVLAVSSVVGGAMFGDNLSIISDTTIAATRTQGCEMKDKFRMNVKLALPAALITLVVLYLAGADSQLAKVGDYEYILILPYLVVLALAVLGINVFVVLFSGLLLASGIGFFHQEAYGIASMSQDIYAGFGAMQETMLLSLMIGGLAALMRSEGGLAWISGKLQSLVSKLSALGLIQSKAGEICIVLLVALMNLATANNTIAILISGSVAKDIAQKYQISAARSASLLDIFSCVVQGLIPYGAQILLASSIVAISPFSLVANIYYSWILAIITLFFIVFLWPRSDNANT